MQISSSERKTLTLCLAVSFLTLIQLIFHMFAFTDQIITNNSETINKLYLQRNEPTNMTNLPSSIPLPLVVDFALKVTSLNDSQVFYINDHVTSLPIHPVTAT